MVIDFHTHTFPDNIASAAVDKLKKASNTVSFSDGSVSGLVSSMKSSGIDFSVVLPVATNPAKVSKINESSAKLNGIDGLFHFGCIHPECEDIKGEMRRAAELGLLGVKLHPVYQNTDINDKKNLEILYAAGENDLTVVTHAGADIGYPGVERCSPKMIREALSEVGNVRLVLAHMGGWKNWEEVPEYLADTSVYLDTAFSLGFVTPLDEENFNIWSRDLLSPEEFVKLCSIFGFDRILFGTDSPWSSQGEGIEFIKALDIPEKEKRKILGENAEKLLKL